jgi:hypothetical protein
MWLCPLIWCMLLIVKMAKIIVVLVDTMRTYSGSTSIAHIILNLSTWWRSVANFTPRPLYPRGWTLVLMEQKAGRTPKPVMTIWRKENSLAPARFRTPDRYVQHANIRPSVYGKLMPANTFMCQVVQQDKSFTFKNVWSHTVNNIRVSKRPRRKKDSICWTIAFHLISFHFEELSKSSGKSWSGTHSAKYL